MWLGGYLLETAMPLKRTNDSPILRKCQLPIVLPGSVGPHELIPLNVKILIRRKAQHTQNNECPPSPPFSKYTNRLSDNKTSRQKYLFEGKLWDSENG